MESFVIDENKAGQIGRRLRINSYSFSTQVLLTVKNCRYLFRLRPMKGTRYFASANDAASQGWVDTELSNDLSFVTFSRRSLDESNCKYLKARMEARAFAIVMHKCVFMNDKVVLLRDFLRYSRYRIVFFFAINLLSTFRSQRIDGDVFA